MTPPDPAPSTPNTLPKKGRRRPSPDKANPDQAQPSEAQQIASLSKSGSRVLRGAVSGAFRERGVRVREGVGESVCKLLRMTAEGSLWKDASKASRVDWVTFSHYRMAVPALTDIYKAAKECGDRLRQQMREDEVFRRGVLGWDEPVYQNGRKVGKIRKYDSKLLELDVKAGNRARFGEDAAPSGPAGGGISYTFIGVVMGQQTGPDATKALPTTIDMRDCPQNRQKTVDTQSTDEDGAPQ